MFGYPTGIGCLIVKLSALTELNRPWFSGGTVEGVSILAEKHVLKSSHDGFHDGTTNFLAMHAVERGLAWLTGIGIDTIHQRVMALTTFLVQEMTALRHQETGHALVRIAGMSRSDGDGGVRGGTIAFNLYDLNGIWINSEIVALQASKRQLYLREGCFCNPGVAETEFKLSKSALCECFTAPTAPPRQAVAVLTKSQSVRNLTAANANSSSQRTQDPPRLVSFPFPVRCCAPRCEWRRRLICHHPCRRVHNTSRRISCCTTTEVCTFRFPPLSLTPLETCTPRYGIECVEFLYHVGYESDAQQSRMGRNARQSRASTSPAPSAEERKCKQQKEPPLCNNANCG